jgi:ABC-type sugar transport system ATPase subunit
MVRVELLGVHLPAAPSRPARLLAEQLTFERGGWNVVLGEPGSGKTALLDVVVGLRAPARGRVLFDGCDVTRQSAKRRNVARVCKAPVVYAGLSARDNIALPLRRRGMRGGDLDARVAPVLEALELQPLANVPARHLAPAQRQRVALGRALARAEASVLVCDEPLAVFAASERAGVRAAVQELASQVRATLLWASAEADEAFALADRCVVLGAGRALQAGAPAELARAPRTTALGAWWLDPPLNVLTCLPRGDTALVAGQRLPVPGLDRFTTTPLPRLELGIRAQDVRLAGGAGERVFDLRLHAVERIGARRFATFTDDQSLTLVAGPLDGMLVVGQRYWVELPAEHLHLYADGERVDA